MTVVAQQPATAIQHQPHVFTDCLGLSAEQEGQSLWYQCMQSNFVTLVSYDAYLVAAAFQAGSPLQEGLSSVWRTAIVQVDAFHMQNFSADSEH